MINFSPIQKLGLIVLVALVLSASQNAWGGFKEGLDALKGGDYVTAIEEWNPLAERKQVGARSFRCGWYEARLRESNWFQWNRKNAEQGNADAQFALGVMYKYGHSIPKDYRLAAKWFRISSDQGNVKAQYNLGRMYEEGKGVLKDLNIATDLYRKSTKQGGTISRIYMGLIYENGMGVSKDYARAFMWFNVAGQNNALTKIFRDAIKKKMTPQQIAEGQKLEDEWLMNNYR